MEHYNWEPYRITSLERKKIMSILIGADIVPLSSNIDLFEKAEVEKLLGRELQNVIEDADFSIFNLEVPLTDIETPINKMGPNFIAPTSSAQGLKAMGIDLLTLANNHIFDQNAQGVLSTISILDKVDIAHIGAGNNVYDAQAPYFKTINGRKYGIYACVEHEFSIAEHNRPGANPFDPLESLDHIQKLKKACDYVIILYHGGKEQYRYPTPYLQKVCHKIIEKGADLVVCQHSHCIGCEEQYLHGKIVYGQGNFLFDKYSNDYWNSSLLILVDDIGTVRYIPIIKESPGVRLASKEQAIEILKAFNKRSMEIKEKEFIEKRCSDLANDSLFGYVSYLTCKRNNIIFRLLNWALSQGFHEYFLNKIVRPYKSAIINYIKCETHRELILNGLEEKYK